MNPPTVPIALVGYVFGFGIAGVACFAAMWRALRIEDAETRRGLVGLLAGSGSWALSTLVLFVAPSPAVGNAVYMVSLIGGSVPASDAGLTLPNLRMLARVHGWDVTVDTGYTDGFRIVVSGARVHQARAA